MNDFHGWKKRRSYFEGWYLKQQSQGQTVAFIPAFHINESGVYSASLQIITEQESIQAAFPIEKFSISPGKFHVKIGDCSFSESGCTIQFAQKHHVWEGQLHYSGFTPLKYDIMGPFTYLPLMQCRHSIFSLYHRVDGVLYHNGKQLIFQNGTGYMEGDRGHSFPNRYLWTQCNWGRNCIVLSIADIPLYGKTFVGCIGVVLFEEKEYRFATYCGVRLIHVSNREILIQQGDMSLYVALLDGKAHPLSAPHSGAMTRTIHESPSCTVRYHFSVKQQTVFDIIQTNASFEACWDSTRNKIPVSDK